MELKGSETEKNLLKAFAGESQARNRYTYFASIADKEGFKQISAIFQETADNEKEHAEIFFKYLQEIQGELLEITAEYPAGKIGKTKENLLASAEGEKLEWGTLYPQFKETAEKEGFKEIAESFKEIAEVEVPEDLFMKAWKEDGDRPGVGVHALNHELKEWVCKAVDGPPLDYSLSKAA